MQKKRTIALSAFILLLLMTLYSSIGYFQLQQAISYSADSSISMGTYASTSKWLSEHLSNDEQAVVPTAYVFELLNPELKGRLIDCERIWGMAAVNLYERGSSDRMEYLRNWFNSFINENPKIKYLVKDWVDQYTRYLFENNTKLSTMFAKPVAENNFTLSTGWSNKIIIYQRITYQQVFNKPFSQELQFHTYPNNISIAINSEGFQIPLHNGVQAGIYLELSEGINVSTTSYISLNMTFFIKNTNLTIVFYYDTNNDCIFNGYESADYVKSGFQEYDNPSNSSCSIIQIIPSKPEKIVQIGLIFNPGDGGSIILHNILFAREIE